MSSRRPIRSLRYGCRSCQFVTILLASNPLPSTRIAMVHAAESSTSLSSSTSSVAKPNHQNRQTTMIEDSDYVVGGGAVNEKKRLYLPSGAGALAGSPRTIRLDDVLDVQKADKMSSSSSSSSGSYNPSLHRSHLLHAIEGLDRYPNYLSRWSMEDAEKLERALEERLDQVRQQKLEVYQQRQEVQQILQAVLIDHPQWRDFVRVPSTWAEIQEKVLDERAISAIFRSKFFRENNTAKASVEDVLSGRIPVQLDTALLQDWMDEEMFDVYSFPLLAESFCTTLHQFVTCMTDAIAASESGTAKTMKLNRGIHKDLDNFGLGWLNDLLFHLVVRPLSSQLYGETELAGGDLDWRQGFIAAYSASPTQSRPRQRLVPHTDDAEVTLNVCLGDKFDGGNLQFWGLRGGNNAGRLVGEYEPEIGRAILHSGRHLHEVTEVTDGNRFAYIQWARSWDSARKGTCPCCWLNRRQGQAHANKWDSCICGSRWN